MDETSLTFIRDLMLNWADYVYYGAPVAPTMPDRCASIEHKYADHNSRFQYESRAPRQRVPNFADGEAIEDIITHPAFPAVWRRIVRVEFMHYRRRPPDVAPGADFVHFKADRARVSPRSYEEWLSAALAFVRRRYLAGLNIYPPEDSR